MKILIFTKNWLGDLLFQFPAIEALRSAYPNAEIVCVAPARCREMLEAYPAADRVFVFDEKREHRHWFARLKFVWRLRAEKWDMAFLFHRSRTRAFLVWLSGARQRIGYGKKRRWFLNRAIQEPAHVMHQVDYFLNLLKESGIAYAGTPAYRFCYSQSALDSVQDLLLRHELLPKTFVCFHLGANWEPKRWPPSHFAKLADLVHDAWQLPVVVTGATRDLPLIHQMIQETRSARVVSLVAQTNLEELGALYAQATFVVSGDSGPMHIASGVGTPIVALFGPTDPHLTGPRGMGDALIMQHIPAGYQVPWYGKELPKEGWLSQIQPHEVIRSIAKKGWIHDSAMEKPSAGFAGKKSRSRNGRLKKNVQNVLLVTLSNIGDVILTTPVIMALVTQFPQIRITIVAGPRAKGVLEGSRYIDRLIIYDKHASWRKRFAFLRELRRESYDWVLDLRNSAIPFLVKSGKRSKVFRRFKNTAMRDRHLEVLQNMGGEISNSFPVFDFFHNSDLLRSLEKLKAKGVPDTEGWILVAPAAASELKTWRLEGFRSVIEKILEERKESILLLGDQRERALAQPLVEVCPERIFNLAGETDLKELAAIVSRGALLLTNDSAVMHLGFELNRPVVAIFGPTNHEKYGREGAFIRIVREPVFCAPCERPTCRFERQACFEDLSAEKVWEACEELFYQMARTSPQPSAHA